jgi:hypothetical protein
MSVDEFVKLFDNFPGWVALTYLFFTQMLPKIAPGYARAMNMKRSREDRLFEILAATNTQNERLANALDNLSDAMKEINHRLEKLEDR